LPCITTSSFQPRSTKQSGNGTFIPASRHHFNLPCPNRGKDGCMPPKSLAQRGAAYRRGVSASSRGCVACALIVVLQLDPQERKELERIIISLQYNGNGHVAAVYARQGHSFMCVHSAFLCFWPCRSAHLFWL
jgi:hypothetical protein